MIRRTHAAAAPCEFVLPDGTPCGHEVAHQHFCTTHYRFFCLQRQKEPSLTVKQFVLQNHRPRPWTYEGDEDTLVQMTTQEEKRDV